MPGFLWEASLTTSTVSANGFGKTHISKPGRKAMKRTLRESVDSLAVDRRRFLGSILGACAISPLGSWSMQLAASMSASLTKEQRDSMTPSQVIDELKKGNERFRTGKMAVLRQNSATTEFHTCNMLHGLFGCC
jgi:hypothetical protein